MERKVKGFSFRFSWVYSCCEGRCLCFWCFSETLFLRNCLTRIRDIVWWHMIIPLSGCWFDLSLSVDVTCHGYMDVRIYAGLG